MEALSTGHSLRVVFVICYTTGVGSSIENHSGHPYALEPAVLVGFLLYIYNQTHTASLRTSEWCTYENCLAGLTCHLTTVYSLRGVELTTDSLILDKQSKRLAIGAGCG